MQKLDIVNDMLGSMGLRPITTLDTQNRMVGSALKVYNKQRKRILSTGNGWWFNRELLTLVPDSGDGRTYVPDDILSVLSSDYANIVQRGRNLYDAVNATDQLGMNVQVLALRDLDVADWPESVAAFLQSASVLDFQGTYDGDSTKTRALDIDNTRCRTEARAEEIRHARVNMFALTNRVQRLRSLSAAYRGENSGLGGTLDSAG